jgi:hypothetical protein
VLLEVTWNEERGVVYFRAGLPVRVPADRRERGAEVVRHANARAAVGAYRMGDEGWVVFGYEALLNHDGTLSTRVAELSTELCAFAARGLAPALAEAVGASVG